MPARASRWWCARGRAGRSRGSATAPARDHVAARARRQWLACHSPVAGHVTSPLSVTCAKSRKESRTGLPPSCCRLLLPVPLWSTANHATPYERDSMGWQGQGPSTHLLFLLPLPTLPLLLRRAGAEAGRRACCWEGSRYLSRWARRISLDRATHAVLAHPHRDPQIQQQQEERLRNCVTCLLRR